MNSLGQARQRCIGLAAELRRKYAPELRVFCDMNVFASPQLAKLSVTEVISPEVSCWKARGKHIPLLLVPLRSEAGCHWQCGRPITLEHG
jgi:hypothetical protein